MKVSRENLKLLLATLCITTCSVGRADYPKEIEISSKYNRIRVGQPLIIQLIYKFEEPRTSPGKDEFLTSIRPQATVEIRRGDEVVLEKGFHFRDNDLFIQNDQGTTYSGNFVFFFDSSMKKQRLIFEKPGTYTIAVKATADIMAVPIVITVEQASESEKKLLSMFSDPLDYAFLTENSKAHFKRRPERIGQIKKVIEGFENTVLAKMAAARLGLEYFRQFHAKHPSFVKFQEEYEKGGVNEPLFEQAHKYLTIGAKLPDEFPVRQDVLKELTVIEFTKGNSEKAISLLDELGAKYPKGKYGRDTAKWKQELLDIQAGKAK